MCTEVRKYQCNKDTGAIHQEYLLKHMHLRPDLRVFGLCNLDVDSFDMNISKIQCWNAQKNININVVEILELLTDLLVKKNAC